MENEKYWRLKVSPDEKWKELAVRGNPDLKMKKYWQLEVSPDERGWDPLLAACGS